DLSEHSPKRSNLKISSYRGGSLGYQYYEDEIVQEHLKQGRHIDQLPRHDLWIRAHSCVKDGVQTFSNPNDYEIAKEIAKAESGEIVLEEHGGRVRGVGSGITNTEYFGFCRPTPPSQMCAELTGLRSEVALMRNNQQFMMTFIMSCLDQEQMKQFMVGLNKMGIHVSDQHGTLSGQKGDMNGSNTDQFGVMNVNDNGHAALLNGQKNGFFTQLLNNGDGDNGLCQRSKGDDGFTQHHKGLPDQSKLSKSQHLDLEKELVQNNMYFVPWPNDKEVGTEQQTKLHIKKTNTSPSAFMSYEIDYDTPISKHVLPQGIYDCCLAIEDDKETQIGALGQVHIPGPGEVTLNHFNSLSHEYRRVSITKEIVPTAPLPCPNEECTVVCQAKYTFISWPAHLIFSKKKCAKIIQNPNIDVLQSPSSQTSTTKTHDISDKNRAKVNSSLKSRGSKLISIPDSVFSHKQDVNLDCEDLFDWCYQREIGSAHMSVFMNHLSESCNKDGVSGMYGFCDSNYLSPLTPTVEQERSDYLSRVFGCNGGKNLNQLFFVPYHEK
ncbi:hypothetical protein RND81_07G037400, partial [Saponaria officinalis]